jgi:hypothetical protein
MVRVGRWIEKALILTFGAFYLALTGAWIFVTARNWRDNDPRIRALIALRALDALMIAASFIVVAFTHSAWILLAIIAWFLSMGVARRTVRRAADRRGLL